MTKEEVITYFKMNDEYSHLKDTQFEIIYEKSKSLIINALFPFDDTKEEIPNKYKYKIIDVMEEVLVRSNMANATSYKENGIEFQWDSSNLNSLKDLIATVGVY